MISGKRFGEQISRVFSRRNPFERNGARLYEVANVKMLDIDVFDFPMILHQEKLEKT
jgi:hypothetical protein